MDHSILYKICLFLVLNAKRMPKAYVYPPTFANITKPMWSMIKVDWPDHGSYLSKETQDWSMVKYADV